MVKMIRVPLRGRAYEVRIGKGLLVRAGKMIVRTLGERPSRVAVVCAASVAETWGAKTLESLDEAGIKSELMVVVDSEPQKTIATVYELLERMASARLDRKSAVVAVGGGVIGDMAGFAAAVYMRGVPVVQIPTTLLAQVDAAIGGKTGVNLSAGKNLAGAFHQPKLVIADTETLTTLNTRELRAGVYEVIKCGVIRDAKLFALCERSGPGFAWSSDTVLQEMITRAVAVKARVVAADEREGDLRRILNFGHTIGHALEAESGYLHFLHGEAMAWGMIAAARIGMEVKVTPKAVAERIESCVLSFGKLPKVKAEPSRIVELIASDKKTTGGVPHFVLPTKIGATKIAKNVTAQEVKEAVEYIRGLSR
jgi:3-dehydroquinate synthase